MTRHAPVSGDPAPSDDRIDCLSRSEIEALCAKAARGAGMAWGLAEEAGFAAGWLSARGIDGPGALADHLAWAEGRSWHALCPTVAPGAWTASSGGMLCPVALGATLCDFCALPAAALDGGGLTVGPVSQPVMLVPFVAAMAQTLGHPVAMDWPGGRVVVAGSGAMAGALSDLATRPAATLRLRRATDLLDPVPAATRAGCSRATIARLDALALKTTVPPSDTSRGDAGAGGSDND